MRLSLTHPNDRLRLERRLRHNLAALRHGKIHRDIQRGGQLEAHGAPHFRVLACERVRPDSLKQLAKLVVALACVQ